MKIFALILICLSFTSCEYKENNKYLTSVTELKNDKVTSDIIPNFDINLKLSKISELSLEYILILYNPSEPIYDLEIILIHDKYTDEKFPSIGIFNNKQGLIPDIENESSGYHKVINLKGYIDYEGDIQNFTGNFKAKITYSDKELKKHIYFYEKHI